MNLTITTSTTGTEANFAGEFTFSDNPVFKDVLSLVEKPEVKFIIINLSNTIFIDSAGLGMLMLLKNAAQKKNISVSLRGAHGQVEKVLKLSKFDEIFSMVA